jgi:hypothetical protein
MHSIWAEVAVACALGLVLFSCSDDGGGHEHTGGRTALKGTLVGPAGESGVLEITIEADRAALESALRAHADHPIPEGATRAGGSIRWYDGTQVGLSGYLDGAILEVHGRDPTSDGLYELDGTWIDGGLDGTYTGPNGAGTFTLSFAETVRVYCGTYTPTAGGTGGTWNLVVRGDEMVGLSRDTGDTATNRITGSLDSTGAFILNEGDATGVIDANDRVSGTYTDGTFQGERCDT